MNNNIIPVVTGDMWVNYGVRTSSSVIFELIKNAKKELILTAFLLREENIIKEIEEKLQCGIKVTIYIYYEPDNPTLTPKIILDKLKSLNDEYPYLKIYEIHNVTLHAKIIISDGYDIYCGSANLSNNGLEKNYELGFLIHNQEIATKIRDLIKVLENL